MPVFSPPTTQQWTFSEGASAPSESRFWAYFGGQPRGQTVLKIGGTYTRHSNPTTEQLAAADTILWPDGTRDKAAYLGGHVYAVTASEAADLVAAGYTVT